MSACAIVIIGFGCSDDIVDCVTSLSNIQGPIYSIHICENGGKDAYENQVKALLELGVADDAAVTPPTSSAVLESMCIRLARGGARVFVHQASGNLGYAGGINAILDTLSHDPSWDAVWVLNPDTSPEPGALEALQRHAATGHYGVVGSRVVLVHNRRIQMYGGRWRRWIARGWNIGLGQPADRIPDVARIEAEMEYVCGASMYVTRPFIDTVGRMEEGYFLYAEEVDWCMRRGDFKLGYAHDSIVHHAHGATIGSNHDRKARSSFSVFLDERSKLLLTRRFYPSIFPVVVLSTLVLTTQYAKRGAYRNFAFALAGWFSGLRGETGYPKRFLPRMRSQVPKAGGY